MLNRKVNYFNKIIALLLVLCLLITQIVVIAVTLSDSSAQLAQADSNCEISKQAINGAKKNVSFDFVADKNINENNYMNFVDIRDMRGAPSGTLRINI